MKMHDMRCDAHIMRLLKTKIITRSLLHGLHKKLHESRVAGHWKKVVSRLLAGPTFPTIIYNAYTCLPTHVPCKDFPPIAVRETAYTVPHEVNSIGDIGKKNDRQDCGAGSATRRI